MARRRLTVKRLDPWSVLKFGFLANLCLLAIGLLGSVVAWFFVNRLDLINKACDVAVSVGFESCGVDGGNLFRLVLLLGLLGVVIQTGVLVFLSFLHNLIADLVGGLQISVLDEAVGATQRATEQVQSARTRPAPIGADRTRTQPPRSSQRPETDEEQAGASTPPTPPSPQQPSPAPATRPGGSTAPEGAPAGERRRGPSTESVFGDRDRGPAPQPDSSAEQQGGSVQPSGGPGETGPIRRAEAIEDTGAGDEGESDGDGDAFEGRRESTWSRRPGRGDLS